MRDERADRADQLDRLGKEEFVDVIEVLKNLREKQGIRVGAATAGYCLLRFQTQPNANFTVMGNDARTGIAMRKSVSTFGPVTEATGRATSSATMS